MTTHEASGLGIYSVFHHMITVALDNLRETSNVIDNKGGPTSVAPNRVTPKVTEFP